MAESDKITCPIAFWYYRRMALIIGLLTAGGLWFLYDGKISWPKKNVIGLAKNAFEAGKDGVSWDLYAIAEGGEFADADLEDEEAIALIKEAHTESMKPMPWDEFKLSNEGKDALKNSDEASMRKAFDAGAAEGADWAGYSASNGLPSDAASAAGAEGGVDRYVALNRAFEAASKKRDWGLYGVGTGRPKWGEDVKYHTKAEIKGQFGFAYGLWAIAGAMLVWALINSRRSLSADADSLTTETGTRVPFADVFRIDKRKWENKGLGYASYRTESGAEKRAVLDDLKYVGTDKILDRLMANFDGELVERVRAEDVDEDGEAEAEPPEAEEQKSV